MTLPKSIGCLRSLLARVPRALLDTAAIPRTHGPAIPRAPLFLNGRPERDRDELLGDRDRNPIADRAGHRRLGQERTTGDGAHEYTARLFAAPCKRHSLRTQE